MDDLEIALAKQMSLDPLYTSPGPSDGAQINLHGKEANWRALINDLYVFAMKRPLPCRVPADQKTAIAATAASGQPRDRTARGWGWRLIRESLCPLAEFDRQLATILQLSNIAQTQQDNIDRFEIVMSGEGKGKKKAHKCLLCKREVIGRGDFNKHYRTHTNHRPYQCRAKKGCHKRFGDASTRVRHERVHQNERFPCKHCQFEYTRKDNRDRHELKCKGYKRKNKRGSGGNHRAVPEPGPPRACRPSFETMPPDVADSLPTFGSTSDYPANPGSGRDSMVSSASTMSRGSFEAQTAVAMMEAIRERDAYNAAVASRAELEFASGLGSMTGPDNILGYQVPGPGLAAPSDPFVFGLLRQPGMQPARAAEEPISTELTPTPSGQASEVELPALAQDENNPLLDFRRLLMASPAIAAVLPNALTELAATPADQIPTIPQEFRVSFDALWRQFSEDVLPNLQQRQSSMERFASLTADHNDEPASTVSSGNGHSFEQLKSMVAATTEVEISALQNGLARAMSLDDRVGAAQGQPVTVQAHPVSRLGLGNGLVSRIGTPVTGPIVEHDESGESGDVAAPGTGGGLFSGMPVPVDRDMSLDVADITSILDASPGFGNGQ